jgi:hypothetical protein
LRLAFYDICMPIFPLSSSSSTLLLLLLCVCWRHIYGIQWKKYIYILPPLKNEMKWMKVVNFLLFTLLLKVCFTWAWVISFFFFKEKLENIIYALKHVRMENCRQALYMLDSILSVNRSSCRLTKLTKGGINLSRSQINISFHSGECQYSE